MSPIMIRTEDPKERGYTESYGMNLVDDLIQPWLKDPVSVTAITKTEIDHDLRDLLDPVRCLGTTVYQTEVAHEGFATGHPSGTAD